MRPTCKWPVLTVDVMLAPQQRFSIENQLEDRLIVPVIEVIGDATTGTAATVNNQPAVDERQRAEIARQRRMRRGDKAPLARRQMASEELVRVGLGVVDKPACAAEN